MPHYDAFWFKKIPRPVRRLGSLLYGGALRFARLGYDSGLRRAERFPIPVISVGNLAVGGTGKTPMVAYLVDLLKSRNKVGVVSRGYGRQTKGVQWADANATAETIGDESLLLYQRFCAHKNVTIAVAENRAQGIRQLLTRRPGTQVVLLDDALQHYRVAPHVHIVLTAFHRPFFNDHLLPLGTLRAPRGDMHRADVIVVTQCPPTLTEAEKATCRTAIRRYSRPEVPIFFATLRYLPPVPIFMPTTRALAPGQPVVLLTGIADAAPLVQHAQQHYQLLAHEPFPDHHTYTHRDLERVLRRQAALPPEERCILTTEKDAMRLLPFGDILSDVPLFYLPIEMDLGQARGDFDALMRLLVG